MIVPSRVARIAGAIVAVAADPRDPSIGVAMAIAAAAHEKVVIVGSFKETELSASLASPYKSLGIRSEFIGSKKGALNATALGDDLRQLSKRLIIISRGTLSDVDALRLASLQSTPVVITEPARSANQDANSR
jgi:hypothetical protein